MEDSKSNFINVDGGTSSPNFCSHQPKRVNRYTAY